jgi:Ca2+-dependent lipid-binding protein
MFFSLQLELYPDSSGQGERRTRAVKQSNCPVFNEIFTFTMPESELLTTSLLVQVWDHDMISRDYFLGETIVRLGPLDFRTEPIHTDWYSLNMEVRYTHRE